MERSGLDQGLRDPSLLRFITEVNYFLYEFHFLNKTHS